MNIRGPADIASTIREADAGAQPAHGYQHGGYAASFDAWGQPVHMPAADGWLLKRSIPGSPLHDATGCYPLFCCRNWRALRDDIDSKLGDCVSLVLVADPFGNHDPTLLERTFDRALAWKEHFVTDLEVDPEQSWTRRHRRNLRTSLQKVRVEACRASDELDAWCELYAQLCGRRAISGIRAFSREAFALQFSVPGLVAFKATVDGRIAGLYLWFEQGDIAYGHLGATNELGYENMAAYALYGHALRHFRGRVRWLDWGASPGAGSAEEGGLTQFKQRWATGTRIAYLCSLVIDERAYAELTTARGSPASDYFPGYRLGE